jgi:septal ring factor EnvC (AmiA/AmiB activator)
MRLAIFLLCLLLSVPAVAQKQVVYTVSKEQLEDDRKKIQAAIAETQEQLDAIKNDKKATMSQLRALQNKLADRQRLIGNINQQLDNIDNTIKLSSTEVGSLKQQLEQLKVRYAQSIRYAYETRSSYDMLAFLFSSSSFNDAMRRMKYLKKFREFRKQQVEQIRITENQLQHKIGVLNAEKAQKDELLVSQVQQKQVLVKETDEQNKVIQDLKGKESQLLKEIEKNRKNAAKIDNAIKNIIEREIKRAEEEERKKAALAAKANPPAKPTATTKPGTNEVATNNPPAVNPRNREPKAETQPLLLTPTDVALSANFEGNKGKLYWPVDKGYISDHFGVHPHPVEHQVMINNEGIDIQTSPGAEAHAVFDGIVSSVFSVGDNSIVLIKHANYFTIYNNLVNVLVKAGQTVSVKQALGTVANGDDGIPTIKFQIWKAGTKGKTIYLNPEQWIGKAH